MQPDKKKIARGTYTKTFQQPLRPSYYIATLCNSKWSEGIVCAPVYREEADDDGDHLRRVHEEEIGVDVARVLPDGPPDEAKVHHEGGEPGEVDHQQVLPDDAVPEEPEMF